MSQYKFSQDVWNAIIEIVQTAMITQAETETPMENFEVEVNEEGKLTITEKFRTVLQDWVDTVTIVE